MSMTGSGNWAVRSGGDPQLDGSASIAAVASTVGTAAVRRQWRVAAAHPSGGRRCNGRANKDRRSAPPGPGRPAPAHERSAFTDVDARHASRRRPRVLKKTRSPATQIVPLDGVAEPDDVLGSTGKHQAGRLPEHVADKTAAVEAGRCSTAVPVRRCRPGPARVRSVRRRGTSRRRLSSGQTGMEAECDHGNGHTRDVTIEALVSTVRFVASDWHADASWAQHSAFQRENLKVTEV